MAMATTRSARHQEPIKVRRMDFSFPESMPTWWFDDNPHLTALMMALAISFPPGERYFIASVRHFLNGIEDPSLRAAVRAFIGQEANHTKEHLAFNRFLDGRGFPATAMEKFVGERLAEVQEASSPEENLARTAALEHFTAILAATLLEHLEVADRMSPEAAKLWVWHAIEELEHRSVAFDVYKASVDDERLRIWMMLETTAAFIAVNGFRMAWLLKMSGRAFDLRAGAKALQILWGRPGLLRKVIPRYLAYYRRDFHPSQHDHDLALSRARAEYLGEAA